MLQCVVDIPSFSYCLQLGKFCMFSEHMYVDMVRNLTQHSVGFLLKFSHSNTEIGCFFFLLLLSVFWVQPRQTHFEKLVSFGWFVCFFPKGIQHLFFVLVLVPSGNFRFSLQSFFAPWDWGQHTRLQNACRTDI